MCGVPPEEYAMKIEVALQCHFFQRRLCWMLSSILEQVDLPEDLCISISVAYVEGTGQPTTEAVLDYFEEQGLHIVRVPYADQEEFQYRGWTRNRQLELTTADWIIFADSDMVYPPTFFKVLYDKVSTTYKDNPHCLYSRRYSTTLEETRKLVDTKAYPIHMERAFEYAQALPGRLKSNVGAGYFQLANVKLLKENHGYYQVPGKKIDRSWEGKGQKAKSDMHFRKMVGREAIGLPIQVHLQHVRDSDFGYHVEVQR